MDADRALGWFWNTCPELAGFHDRLAAQALKADGLLTTNDWLRVLDELRAGDAATLVVSGGGEALLNRELPTIITRARELGFRVHLYTTGFNLHPHDTALWEALLGIEKV